MHFPCIAQTIDKTKQNRIRTKQFSCSNCLTALEFLLCIRRKAEVESPPWWSWRHSCNQDSQKLHSWALHDTEIRQLTSVCFNSVELARFAFKKLCQRAIRQHRRGFKISIQLMIALQSFPINSFNYLYLNLQLSSILSNFCSAFVSRVPLRSEHGVVEEPCALDTLLRSPASIISIDRTKIYNSTHTKSDSWTQLEFVVIT